MAEDKKLDDFSHKEADEEEEFLPKDPTTSQHNGEHDDQEEFFPVQNQSKLTDIEDEGPSWNPTSFSPSISISKRVEDSLNGGEAEEFNDAGPAFHSKDSPDGHSNPEPDETPSEETAVKENADVPMVWDNEDKEGPCPSFPSENCAESSGEAEEHADSPPTLSPGEDPKSEDLSLGPSKSNEEESFKESQEDGNKKMEEAEVLSGNSSPPPDPSPTPNSEQERRKEDVSEPDAKGDLSDVSDVEFLDEVPKQIQNQSEAVNAPTSAPVTVESFRERFLDLVEKTGSEPSTSPTVLEQKLTDVLSRFAQQESVISPLGVRKIVEGKEFLSPSGCFFPPSQVVQLMSWYEPEEQLRSLIDSLFGADATSPDSMSERKHKQEFRMFYPAPNITRVLYDIGLQLAQESTYSDIVSMKNLPSEMPRKPDTISKVVAQVKPYLEMLKTQTGPYKGSPIDYIKMERCKKCSFRTESEIVMDMHMQQPHFREKTQYWHCVHCEDFRTRKRERIEEHYLEEHGMEAHFQLPPSKNPCTYCDEEFMYKGVLLQHLRNCKRQIKHRHILTGSEEDRLTANKWLWPKPANVPSSGVTTGVRVLQMGSSQPGGVQYISATGIPGASMLRLQNQRNLLRVPPTIGNFQQQQQFRRQPNILPKTAGMRPGSAGGHPMQRQQQMILQQQQNRMGPSVGGRSQVQILNRAAGLVEACEICDSPMNSRDRYLEHLQGFHKRILNKTRADFIGGAPLACSRCKDRFWTYEGLERHLVMTHGLVTSDLLQKAQNKLDSGRCVFCNKQYAFNLLQHLVMDHKKKLCSAEILYSCDVCTYQCTSYTDLERHLNTEHGNHGMKRPAPDPPLGAPNPVKTMRLAAPQPQGAAGSRVVHMPRPQQPPQEPPKGSFRVSKIRYTCTPCSLKFAAYSDVIAHWQEKHLEKVKPHLCRVDTCEKCKGEFAEKGINVDWEFPERNPDGVETKKSDVICLD